MYNFELERIWAQQEEREMEEQVYQQQLEHYAHEEREHERWLEDQYFQSLDVDEYESYCAFD